MKKQKLLVDYEFHEFKLIGLISVLKEYKLAWSLNKELTLDLIKQPDLQFDFVKGQNINISNFLFETEHSKLWLLKNEAVDNESPIKQFLIPELNYFDYFILIHDFGEIYQVSNVKECLKRIASIHFLQEMDINNLKSKDNLIF